MLSSTDYSHITTALFSASLGMTPWEELLRDLSERSGGVCTHIFGFDTEARLTMDMISSGYDPHFLRTFEEHYAALNAWGPGFAEKAAGQVIDCEEMLSSEKLVRTEWYNDWLRPQGDIMHGAGALLFKSDTRVFALGGNIRTRDVERLKEPWTRTVTQLIPQMQQAFEISRALAGSRLETAIVAREGLREVPGILVLSETGRVVFANDVAETMLAIGVPLFTDWRGVLGYGLSPGERRSSVRVLQHELLSENASFSVELRGRASDDAFDLRFTKLHEGQNFPHAIDRALGLSGRCCIVIVSRCVSSDAARAVLRGRGLTASEAHVATLIAEGRSLQEIAELRQTSIHTVRNQTKSIMWKFDVKRQTELVRALLDLRVG